MLNRGIYRMRKGGGVRVTVTYHSKKSHLNCDAVAIDYTILCEMEDV